MAYISRFVPGTPNPIPGVSDVLVSSSIYVGIELELENVRRNVPEDIMTHWRIAGDGSLRNHGKEFIFDGPKAGTAITDAVRALYSNWQATWDANNRCSTHVHLDMSDTHHGQVGWVYIMAVCLEDYLSSLADSDYRKSSVFCRSSSGNIAQMNQMLENIRQGDRPEDSNPVELITGTGGLAQYNDLKYSSINAGSLNRFGTLEFRNFAPVTSQSDMLIIINTIMELKLAATSENPLEDFVNRFEERAPEACDQIRKYGVLI